jgi:hypothetical protein
LNKNNLKFKFLIIRGAHLSQRRDGWKVSSVDKNFKLKVFTKEFKMTFLDFFSNVNNNTTRRTWRVDTTTNHADGILKFHSLSFLFEGLADGENVIRCWKIRSAKSSCKLCWGTFLEESSNGLWNHIIDFFVSSNVTAK